ncbi:MAG TPA: GntR family transcriptional regulator [Ilumatobacter sp.]|nr:GntR family transcriptional regulator [Ilumatobacter sp.]
MELQSTVAAVTDEIRTRIGSGRYAPGQRLVAALIADDLGVSVQPVREALMILQAEGRVTHDPGRGHTVTELSAAELREIYRLRDLVEDEALRRSFPHFDAELIAALAAAADRFDAAVASGVLGEIRRTNQEFHDLLRSANPMPRLDQLVEQLRAIASPYRARYFEAAATWQPDVDDHWAMVRAIEAKDLPALLAVTYDHRARVVAVLTAHADAALHAAAPSIPGAGS